MNIFYSVPEIFLFRNFFAIFIIMPCFSLVIQVFLIFLGSGFPIVKTDFIAINLANKLDLLKYRLVSNKVRQLEA